MTADITITKGSFSLTIGTTNVTENWDNDIFLLKPPQTKQKQSDGPKQVKVVDLLRIIHTIIVRGFITPTASKTAKEVKDDLITIFKGAQQAGGPCTVVYAGDSYDMYIEKMTIIEDAFDEPTSLTTDVGKYSIQITLTEGVSI